MALPLERKKSAPFWNCTFMRTASVGGVSGDDRRMEALTVKWATGGSWCLRRRSGLPIGALIARSAAFGAEIFSAESIA